MTHQLLVKLPAKLMAKLDAEKTRRGLPSLQAAIIVAASEFLGVKPEIPYPFGRKPKEEPKKPRKKSR